MSDDPSLPKMPEEGHNRPKPRWAMNPKDRLKMLMEQGKDPKFLPVGHPQREQNLAEFMEGAHPELLNEDGTPKVLYHGTKGKDYSAFKESGYGHWGPGGIYLTTNPEMANWYAMNEMSGKKVRSGSRVIPVHVNLKNPYVISKPPANLSPTQLYHWEKSQTFPVIPDLKKHGHDGIIDNNGQETWVVPFSSKSIKSAIGNRGTYDKREDDINKAKGGGVESDFEVAKRLGMDTSSIPEVRKAGQLREAHQTLGEKIREGAKIAAQRAKEYHESGKLPFPIGTRFTTEHTRKHKQPPIKVLGHYVDSKDPDRYGYFTEQGEEGSNDYTRTTHLVSDPKADARMAKIGHPFDRKAYWDTAQVLGGITRVKADGGPISQDAMRLALLNRPHMARGGRLPKEEGVIQDFTPAGIQGTQISKHPGGQWLEGRFGGVEPSLKVITGPMTRIGIQTDAPPPENNPAYDWVNTTLAKYLKRDLGTEGDPVRALAEKGITHYPDIRMITEYGKYLADAHHLRENRKFAGLPEKAVAKSHLARGWEAFADSFLTSNTAGNIISKSPVAKEILEENPWLGKVDPETIINRVRSGADDLGFRHLYDELQNAINPQSGLPNNLILRPESLKRMSVPQAVHHVHKINEWRKENKKKIQEEKFSEMTPHKKYPDGMRWVILDKPGQFADESDAMGHSVRGYEPESNGGSKDYGLGGWKAIESNKAKIFSLRDQHNQPHVTIETTYPDKSITQIKGKSNEKPADKYIPYVQDFVKSDNWQHVDDFDHTDLLDMENLHEPHRTHYFKNAERYAPHAQAYQQRTGEYPRFLTEHEFYHPEKWNNETPVQKKAGGGIIKETTMPTLAQMKAALQRGANNLQTIGAQEAPDMRPKVYIPPDQPDDRFLPPGGVSTPSGMPIGGIDMSRQAGQQLMPQNMMQTGGMQQPGQPPQGQMGPQDQGPQGAPQGAPQGGSNILSLTPQGQALSALKPSPGPQGPAPAQGMADGGTATSMLDSTPEYLSSTRSSTPPMAIMRQLVQMGQKMARGGAAKFEIKPAAPQPKTPDNFTPYNADRPTTKSLAKAFDEAIAHHLNLSPEERAVNSQRAASNVADVIGRTSVGKPKDLLGKNEKLKKAEKGGESAITLPDGRGVETTGLALAPAYEQNDFNTCPNHFACKQSCLGKTSGNYFKLGGGQDLEEFKGPRLNSLMKTLAFLKDPHSFAVKLHDEIQAAKDMAAANGNHLGVRLNVLSDIHPRVHKALIDHHNDVTFYDYTKNNTNPIASNHHYTYSSSGVNQPGVDNPNADWKRMRKRLNEGDNVSMVFSHKDHLPHEVHDQETGKVYRVIDGDTHDFRPLDIQPEGEDGVIIGLRNKSAIGAVHSAHKDSNGFVVHYDPQLKTTPKGTYERTASTRISPTTGKPMLGETIPQNRRVSIIRQDADRELKGNDGEKA